MALITKRNNIEPILSCVAFVVMILVGIRTAFIALIFGCRGYSPTSNGIANCPPGSQPFGAITHVFFIASFEHGFAGRRLVEFLFCNFAFFGFLVSPAYFFMRFTFLIFGLLCSIARCLFQYCHSRSMTLFAFSRQAVAATTVFKEVRKLFVLLARWTLFHPNPQKENAQAVLTRDLSPNSLSVHLLSWFASENWLNIRII